MTNVRTNCLVKERKNEDLSCVAGELGILVDGQLDSQAVQGYIKVIQPVLQGVGGVLQGRGE